MSPTSIAAYVVLFGSVGLLFLLVSLLVGRLVRPAAPTPAKLDAYECGEPAVGSSFVQFDLRFYVVALVFIVFEVEVALFFPPATIFGTASRWMKARTPPGDSGSLAADLGVTATGVTATGVTATGVTATGVMATGVTARQEPTSPPALPSADTTLAAQTVEDARKLALAAAADLAAFFALILFGFAYVWRRGDLDWVRAIETSQSRRAQEPQLVP